LYYSCESGNNGAFLIKVKAMTEERRWQRLQFRSWHRGMREMDLLLGPFANANLPDFDERQLTAYEALLECADEDLFNWISGAKPVPDTYEGEVIDLLRNNFKKSVR